MGFEIFLGIPLILIVGFTIVRYMHSTIAKIIFIVLTVGFIFLYLFVYPGPLDFDWNNKRIFFNREGSYIGFVVGEWLKKILSYIGIQLI